MKSQLLPLPAISSLPPSAHCRTRLFTLYLFIATVFLLWIDVFELRSIFRSSKSRFQKCSIDTYLSTGLPFLRTAQQPLLEEYVLRRDNLARALAKEGIDAFVVEPGYSFSYYANISQTDWEPWEESLPNIYLAPEERPFLMIIRPSELSDGSIVANTSFLVPHFEEIRARLLNMPFTESISTITYEEHWDPYTTLWESLIWGDKLSPVLMVDDEMRDFISRGLANNGFTALGLSGSVEEVQQIKTQREIGILRAVNTGTVEAIRAMRKCLYPDVTSNEVVEVLDNTLRAGGLTPFFNIVEFGRQAALPHGGHDGTTKLKPGDFILIDVGAHLYGYSSDVTRTFFPPFFPKPIVPQTQERNITEQLAVWQLVLSAQSASVKAMIPNATAASVDIAARNIITAAGYGDQFTHRLGHGIGIKAHESPYLNKGNYASVLKPGMVFTSEPGVYVLGQFGVRHEDVLVVREEGEAENISGGFAESPWDP